MKKIVVVSSLVFLVVVIGWVVDLVWSAGQFKTIEPHFDGRCTQVEGVTGAEDITIHPETGIAFISACDRRAVNEGRPGRGRIFAYDLNADHPKPADLTPGAAEDFQPHGLSLYVGDEEQDTLFVVNHEGGTHRIEVYDVNGAGLSHRRTLSDPMLVSPNDVVAVGPDRFYVSNDHRYAPGMKRMMEEYLRLRLSNILYYDGSRFTEAASGFGYANGINVSVDRETLYLCAVTERSLHVFDREPSTGKLIHRERVELNTGVDNVEVDAEGGLSLTHG
jgi:arylesterase/paraoxonase